MLGILLVGMTLFFLAFTIKELLQFKMEQSLFLAVCAVIIFLFIFGIAGYLGVGYFFILALSFAGFAASLVLLFFSKKRRGKFTVKSYLTPGVVVFILTNAIYYYFMRGNIMAITDAAAHWGYATKWMYETDKIYKGVQTLSVPLLNYFVIKTAGYNESYFFLGRWMFMWAAIILPMSNIKWDKWYKALLYAVMVYMLLGVIDPEPKMFMDLPMGVFAGALCAMLAVMHNKSKTILVAAVGTIVLSNVKNGLGLVLALFVAGFAVVIYLFDKKESEEKRLPYFIGIFIPALALAELFRRVTHEIKVEYDLEPGAAIPLNYQEIISKLTQKSTLLLLIASVVAFTFFVFLIVKKNRQGKKTGIIYKATISVMCLFIGLTIYKIYSGFFSSLSYDDQVILIRYWEAYNIKGYFGWQMRNLFGILIAFSAICGFLCLKKEYISSMWAQSVYMIVCVIFYAFALILAYLAVFCEMEAQGYAAMHRYIGSSIVFVAMWITGYIVLTDGIWQEEKRQLIAAFILLAFLSRETPAIGTVYNYGLRGEAGVHRSVMANGEYIKSHTEPDSKIYFISQDYDKATYLDSWSSNAWIRYEIVPRYLNWVFWSLGDSFNDVDPSTINIDSEGFKDILLSQGYDYVYLFDADDYFWDNYGNLFAAGAKGEENVLYRVTSAEDYLLEPVN